MATVLVIPAYPSAEVANELARRVLACGCSLALEDHSRAVSPDQERAAIELCDTILVAIVGQAFPGAVSSLVEIAAKQGKRICGIWGRGIPIGPGPQLLEDVADAVLAWNSENFCRAVCEDERVWEEADGGVRSSPNNPHHRC